MTIYPESYNPSIQITVYSDNYLFKNNIFRQLFIQVNEMINLSIYFYDIIL